MIGAAAYRHLKADAGVQAQCKWIYPAVIPQGKPAPAIVYGVEQDEPLRTMDGASLYREARLDLDCYATKYVDAQAIADAVEDALTDYRGLLGQDATLPADYSLTPDPYFATIRWTIGDSQWFSIFRQSIVQGASFEYSVAHNAITTLQADVGAIRPLLAWPQAIDTARAHTSRVSARRAGPQAAELSFGVMFFDSGNDPIGSATSDATGWTSITSDAHLALVDEALTLDWQDFSTTFGPGTARSMPTGTVKATVYLIGNSLAVTSSVSQYRDAAVFVGTVRADARRIQPGYRGSCAPRAAF
jgi:hypothetical protein